MAHSKRLKDKVRRSGLSLQNKTRDSGVLRRLQRARVLEPNVRVVENAMHVPRGQRVPDLNRIVCPHVPVTVPSSVSNTVANSSSFVDPSCVMRDRATAERHDRAA
ncbi:uncharacterized protein PG986_014689 [Apiospora aurea]|uniref:Uncharacterized protein n=1 Tax=Apiospora aurea TaxID=335848 RepID=A0ABR1PTP2_9PEZI